VDLIDDAQTSTSTDTQSPNSLDRTANTETTNNPQDMYMHFADDEIDESSDSDEEAHDKADGK
jgi:hypothetical protein